MNIKNTNAAFRLHLAFVYLFCKTAAVATSVPTSFMGISFRCLDLDKREKEKNVNERAKYNHSTVLFLPGNRSLNIV